MKAFAFAAPSLRVRVAVLLLLGFAFDAHSADQVLVDFEIEDQFKNIHRRADVLDHIVLLIGSDKDGSQYNEDWGKAIHSSLIDHPQYHRISQLALADLRSVPFFLKGFVRRKFPENPDRWILLDWEGTIADTYDFDPESSNLLVFAPDGVLKYRASGREPDNETLEALVITLRELLDATR
jgi:hypothetical protein